jgi:hypothetical protein
VDSSGNLLMGTTVNDGQSIGSGSQNGIVLAGESQYIQRGDNANLWLSKPSGATNSEFIKFYKGGTIIGSIGAVTQSGATNLVLDSNSAVYFDTNARPNTDNTYDLGSGTYRFKDLYLSGVVFLGTNITATGVTTGVNAWKSTSNSTSASKHMIFANPNGNVGDIRTNGSATSYVTSSDYRLKENVEYDWDATTRLKQLRPSRFNFIADADTTVDGFLAHEVQDIVPEAISGVKDEMKEEEYEVTPAVLDEDGNVVTEAVMGTREVPEYQGIDQSKLVPLLTKALQEQQTLIESLEARITALES